MVTGGKHPRSHDGIDRPEPTVGPSSPSGVSSCWPSEAPASYPVSDKAVAEVRKVGRWTYRVAITHGILQWGGWEGYGWHVWGRRRADRKATRELAAYLRQRARHADVHTIEDQP